MAQTVDMAKGKRVFEMLLQMLDRKGWHYDKHEEKLLIKSGAKGEDLPVEFVMVVSPEHQVVQFLSRLPFEIPEDKRVDAAIAVCVANYGLCQGSFDYDLRDGSITFRLTSCYCDSDLGEELFEFIMMVALSTVDKYNDKFFMLSKGVLTLEQFIESEND